jgi:AraC-like DNA-binding protein
VHGVRGSATVIEGACSPSYLELSLAPLGAYAVLGVPMDELDGHLVDLTVAAPEVRQSWRRLVASGGAQPIGRITKDVGWSHKHLITRFRQQVGLTPKTARLIRFDRARSLAGTRAQGWDRTAADAGYADQSHLIRDFTVFSGSRRPGWLIPFKTRAQPSPSVRARD